MGTTLHDLSYGLGVAVHPVNLLAGALGVIVGTTIGVIPALGPTQGAALLLPIVFRVDHVLDVTARADFMYDTGASCERSTTPRILSCRRKFNSCGTRIYESRSRKAPRCNAVDRG